MLRVCTTRGSTALLALGLAGCNQYELFRVAGYAQEGFSNDADVLFVLDNSSSMQDESTALALNFDVFIRRLTDPTEGAIATDGLVDAVDNYITYIENRELIVDYQLAITTTDVAGSWGALYGDTPVLSRGDADIALEFNRNLLCHATCFSSATLVPADPSYVCEDPPLPPGDAVSVQYLDCLCGGTDQWEDQCGSGTEEPLEAIYMAMCRAVENPPPECYDDNQFTEADRLSNDGMMREGAALIPIIVTDEGDTSRRMSQGDDEPDEYAQLFDAFGHRMAFAVIGPQTEECNSGAATTWGVDRYQWFVDETGGRYFLIEEKDDQGECGVTDFAVAMEELGELLNSLLDAFPLQSIPDVDTIVVFVDNTLVMQSSESINETEGTVTYSDGWSYLSEENAIEFHGSAVPDYNAEVRIYYRPLEGMPRDLPF
jgi:hypothetical protein